MKVAARNPIATSIQSQYRRNCNGYVDGQKISTGCAAQITDKAGKLFYTGVGSIEEGNAKAFGLKVEIVKYWGNCIYANINERAHAGRHIIEIDGNPISNFISKVAKPTDKIKFK